MGTMLIEAVFHCAHCGEVNETSVDPSQGDSQSYVEDCQVCCHANVLAVEIDGDEAFIEATLEDG
jgi:hypothetical protein